MRRMAIWQRRCCWRRRPGAGRAGPGFLLRAVRRLRPGTPRPIVPMPFARMTIRPTRAAFAIRRLWRRWQAYCVRTCDGRYFPITGIRQCQPGGFLQQLLPGERNQGGLWQQYRQCRHRKRQALFRHCRTLSLRNELVAGCTCNGKDRSGLAQVKVEDDPTLRQGDIVAGEGGLVVAHRSPDRRGAALNFSPASDRIKARYQRVPVVAKE